MSETVPIWFCEDCGWECAPNPAIPLGEAECDNCGAELTASGYTAQPGPDGYGIITPEPITGTVAVRPAGFAYTPSRYDSFRATVRDDGSVNLFIGKEHAGGYNSESIVLPPEAAGRLGALLRKEDGDGEH